MQQEGLLVGPLQRVDKLLILAGAERRDHQRLGLAAREQGRAVGPRQYTDLAHNRAHGLHVAAIDARSGVEDIVAHDLGFEVLEDVGDLKLRMFRILDARRQEVPHDAFFGGVDCLVAFHLIRKRISGAQILFDHAAHLAFQGRIVIDRKLARFLRRLFREPDDGFDHRLEMPMPEHHRAEHHVLTKFLCFRFDHQHRVLRAGDDEIELAFAASRRALG